MTASAELDPQRAQRAAQVRDQLDLAASLTHQLNNPVAGVLNNVQLAERIGQKRGMDARLAETLAAAREEALRLADAVRGLSELAAHCAAGEHALPLDALARGCFGLIRHRLRAARVRVELEVTPGGPPVRNVGCALPCALLDLLDEARDGGEQLTIRTSADDGAVIDLLLTPPRDAWTCLPRVTAWLAEAGAAPPELGAEGDASRARLRLQLA